MKVESPWKVWNFFHDYSGNPGNPVFEGYWLERNYLSTLGAVLRFFLHWWQIDIFYSFVKFLVSHCRVTFHKSCVIIYVCCWYLCYRRNTYNHLSSWLTDARNLTNPNTVSCISCWSYIHAHVINMNTCTFIGFTTTVLSTLTLLIFRTHFWLSYSSFYRDIIF